jgi:hypothetical protein
MHLTFKNGYVVGIHHPDSNSFISMPEVGYWRADEEEPMKIAYFVDADELLEVLDMISKL